MPTFQIYCLHHSIIRINGASNLGFQSTFIGQTNLDESFYNWQPPPKQAIGQATGKIVTSRCECRQNLGQWWGLSCSLYECNYPLQILWLNVCCLRPSQCHAHTTIHRLLDWHILPVTICFVQFLTSNSPTGGERFLNCGIRVLDDRQYCTNKKVSPIITWTGCHWAG